MHRTIFRATRPAVFGRDIHLFVGEKSDQRFAIAEPLVFKMSEEGVTSHDQQASLILAPEDAQALMDELWHVGVRPSEGQGSAGQMAATNAHLQDMRVLAFKALATDKP